jgi:hypothetical protein
MRSGKLTGRNVGAGGPFRKEGTVKTRRTMTIVETHEITVLNSTLHYGAFCLSCAKVTRTLDASEAAALGACGRQGLNRWLDTGIIHFAGSPDSGLICLDSLLAAVANITVETRHTLDGEIK